MNSFFKFKDRIIRFLIRYLSDSSYINRRSEGSINSLHERDYELNHEDLKKGKYIQANISLEKELKEQNNKILTLEVKNKALEQQYCDLIRKLQFINSQHKSMLNDLMISLQQSEILLADAFDKLQTINFFSSKIEEILRNEGIEVFEDKDVFFNPDFHHVVSTIPIDDYTKDGFISESLGKGFKQGVNCLIKQDVKIFKKK